MLVSNATTMFLFFHFFLHILFLFSLAFPTCLVARSVTKFIPTHAPPENLVTIEKYNTKWSKIDRFLNVGRGSDIEGISEIKKYFHHFGYLAPQFSNITNEFDDSFESAVKRYQSKLGLQVTGQLDFDTLSQIVIPRCGVRDTNKLYARKHFLHSPRNPRWARPLPATLTYAFQMDNMIKYITLVDIRGVFKRAFSRWASVVPITFTETNDYDFSDIKIGFYTGDHGDGEPFDGILGILAHAFSPESGKFHLDAAETWATDFDSEHSKNAIDLESVVTHEIGHLLGLGHSSVKEAVMYPSLKPRERKVDLKVDDIEGVQALYGSNPNFRFGSLSESDTSANHSDDHLRIRLSELLTLLLTLVINTWILL